MNSFNVTIGQDKKQVFINVYYNNTRFRFWNGKTIGVQLRCIDNPHLLKSAFELKLREGWRPKSKSKIKRVYSFEVPSSTEWYFPSQFSPNFFVNIDNEIKSKITALKKYKTELNKFPHPRSTIALDAIAKKWGSVSGYNNAEAFTLIRELTD